MPSARDTPALPAPRLAHRFADGVPAVVVLAGTERWFREEGLARTVAHVLPDGDPGGAFLRWDARREDHREGISGAVDELRSTSLFGDGKVVAIDNPEVAAGPWAKGRASPITNLVRAALAAARPGATLVLLTEKPVRGRSAVSTKLLAQEGALVVDCRALYDAPGPWERGVPAHQHELARFLEGHMSRAHGKRLSLPDAHALTQLVGRELGKLVAALETLALYVGRDRDAVVSNDVHEALGSTRTDPAWRLCDAVFDRDLGRALELTDTALDRGIPDASGSLISRPDALFPYLIATFHSAYRRVLAGAEALSRGEDGAEAARALGVPSFGAQRFLARCDRDPRELLARHGAFLEAELGFKGGTVPSAIALQRLVVRLASPQDPAPGIHVPRNS